MKLLEILKGSEYSLAQFSGESIQNLENRIQYRQDGEPGIECLIRGKNPNGDYFKLTPEGVVRQLFAEKLITEYGYSKDCMEFEKQIKSIGRKKTENDRADIVVYTDKTKQKVYIIAEVKRPKEQSGEAQLQSYLSVENAAIGVLTNGDTVENFYLNRIDSKTKTQSFEPIEKIPKANETLDDILNNRFTLKTLIENDALQKDTLKGVVKRLEQRFSANDSSDKSFEEIFKLIYCKLFDEYSSGDDAEEMANQQKYHKKNIPDIDDTTFRQLEFRSNGDETTVAKRICDLFANAQKEWKGIFPSNAVLDMQDSTIKSCVYELQNVKLFNSNLEVIDEAFEYLVNKEQKGEMGQYFTPRYAIDMCVQMLNPKSTESMIDTASGSCGFPMHAIFHVWKQILKEKGKETSHLLTLENKPKECNKYVENNVFAIDFSEKSVRVGKTLNVIAGDGHTNVLYLNTLDYSRWEQQFINDKTWRKKYGEGFNRLAEHCTNKDDYSKFDFDILMANPPFAGDLDNKKLFQYYDLAKNAAGKTQNKVGRDILFIERNLNFLKLGGRMAIVLPQGRFNNSTDKYIRDYIAERCRILAVVGLHGNVFKPHTPTKTSVLLVQKWDDKLCPKQEDYPIFFATMQEPGKDNSGDKMYVTEDYVTCTQYSYETVEVIENKQTGEEVSKEVYDKADKKSQYSVKQIVNTTANELKGDDGKTKQIKDFFIAKYGDIDSHKTWIKENVMFTLKATKNAKTANTLATNITLSDYLKLSEEERKKYKKTSVLGKNQNPPISLAEYNALSADEKKYCLKLSAVAEWTERVKDTHGHYFVKHDLFNHDPELEPKGRYCRDGIAEAFAEFAKKEHLSFFE